VINEQGDDSLALDRVTYSYLTLKNNIILLKYNILLFY